MIGELDDTSEEIVENAIRDVLVILLFQKVTFDLYDLPILNVLTIAIFKPMMVLKWLTKFLNILQLALESWYKTVLVYHQMNIENWQKGKYKRIWTDDKVRKSKIYLKKLQKRLERGDEAIFKDKTDKEFS